ncbi:MAG TPA: polyprenyl synthetase family protein [Candidatus Latescibacteria bacterium]|nr:polyprenyl synthetase family protein [Candidatus Latescibacterota bacterium]
MDYKGRERMFLRELSERNRRVREYLCSKRYRERFPLAHIHDSAYSYIESGGKSLRPAVLLFSCGALGGDEEKAMPAACGVEIFHTWTLVHDDIIDDDSKRRGKPTVHEEFSRRIVEESGLDEEAARHYGLSIGILAGDVQHGWATSLFTELATENGIRPEVALYLIDEMNNYVLNILVSGELLDIQYSKQSVDSLTEEAIVDMLWKKTGVLYEFAGRAGAMIGLNSCEPDHKAVKAISSFCSKCGTAFQLQDDILGIVGDEDKLGKPVGSDIREGKRTTIVYYAFENATQAQKRRLLEILGNKNASAEEITWAKELLLELGGVERTKALAERYITDAMVHLNDIPESTYKELLSTWAEYMINREL